MISTKMYHFIYLASLSPQLLWVRVNVDCFGAGAFNRSPAGRRWESGASNVSCRALGHRRCQHAIDFSQAWQNFCVFVCMCVSVCVCVCFLGDNWFWNRLYRLDDTYLLDSWVSIFCKYNYNLLSSMNGGLLISHSYTLILNLNSDYPHAETALTCWSFITECAK